MTEPDLGTVDLDTVDPVKTIRLADIPESTPETRWLVDGVWPSGGVGVIAATAKIGKTWLAVDLGVSIASGTPFLGHFAVARPGKVIMFASEDRNEEMRARINGIVHQRGLSLERLAFELIDEPTLTLNRARDLSRLERLIRDDRPAAIVLDPIRRVFGGHESSSDAMSSMLTQFRRLQREYGAAIVLTHHITKQSEYEPVSGYSLRGSGDIHAFGDVNLYVWRSREDDSVSILRIEHRNSPPRPSFLARRVCSHADDGTATTYLEYVPDGVFPSSSAPTKGDVVDLRERIAEALIAADEGLGFNALREQLAVSAERLSAAMKELEREGRVSKSGRAWVYRSVPSEP